MHSSRRACFALAVSAVLSASFQSNAFAATFTEDATIPAPAGVTQLVYSAKHQRLVARVGGESIYSVNPATGAKVRHAPVSGFTDMALSLDGDYVYASDYGGEWIGYGEPIGEHRVHRLSLSAGGWAIRNAYIAGSIESMGNGKLLMQSLDQWISFTVNRWGTGTDLAILNGAKGQWSGVYSGHMKYQSANSRVIHGNSGLSSQEITAFKVVNDQLVQQESTGIYGTAQGYGGTSVLSTDGAVFYYGSLAVDANNVTRTLRVFPEWIYAASGSRAFGDGQVYGAKTGAVTFKLGYQTTVYGLGTDDNEFWAYDPSALKFRHYTRR
ncbi:MAG: hypothetical protein U1F53_16125 [Burkholderiaceae bacterium]